ncbi:amidase family protein [Actinophytocola sp.]|uniref:amidase family protein n=1 Tax=Actinophytocola sp. TaxID=1872138 RepID=UPI003D6AA253
MFRSPSERDIAEVAASLGIHLTLDEAQVYRTFVAEQLSVYDEFIQSRVPEISPPLLCGNRDPGYRPRSEEDPLNAWLWRCNISSPGIGLLQGKTVSFKDHVSVAGMPLTFNSSPMEGFIANFDATIVTRVLRAGGTIIGKNTMNGFTGGEAMGGRMGDFWRPVNPRDPERLPGGSSSGSAVAVASGDVDVSFGGDQAGSIRIPAAYCGVVGMKPTFGLVPNMGAVFGSDPSVDHLGPLARYVEDAAAALEAVAGHDPLDPRQGRDVPESMDVMSHLEDGVKGLRVGVLREAFDEPIDPDVRRGVLDAVAVLEKAGADVLEISIPEHRQIHTPAAILDVGGAHAIHATGAYGAWAQTFYPASLIAAIDRMWAWQGDLLATKTKLRLVLGELARRNFNGAAYAKAQNVRPFFRAGYDRQLEEVDLLAMPTCRTVAPRIPREGDEGSEASGTLSDGASAARLNSALYNTKPFNYTGHPGIAIPCGKSSGLPYSLQLVGRHFDDALVLRAAYKYQESVHWARLISV